MCRAEYPCVQAASSQRKRFGTRSAIGPSVLVAAVLAGQRLILVGCHACPAKRA
jgi:hypothetical protein